MWNERFLKYGGLQDRYKVHRGGLVRCIDPVRRKTVTFGTELQYENWLLKFLNPDVLELNTKPAQVSYLREGRRYASTPHLTWRTREGKKVFEWVIPAPIDDHQQELLQHFAVTHDVTVALRTRLGIRGNKEYLLDNLEWARQAMTIHADDDIDLIWTHVERYLRWRDNVTRAELASHLASQFRLSSLPLLDATLFHLQWRRLIRFDMERSLYGDATVIFFL